jgi:hypothetical protein
MFIKFTTEKEITNYLYIIDLIKYESEGINITSYIFNNISFNTPNDLVNYLIQKQIVNEVSRPTIKYKKDLVYEFEYYLMNTHYLNTLINNLYLNPDIYINRLLS